MQAEYPFDMERNLECVSFAVVADVVNIAVVVAFDALLLYFWGFKALMYLLTGNIFGGGLHPMAGHLIAEHYTFIKVTLLVHLLFTPCHSLNGRMQIFVVYRELMRSKHCVSHPSVAIIFTVSRYHL